jgi:hypothetical protein
MMTNLFKRQRELKDIGFQFQICFQFAFFEGELEAICKWQQIRKSKLGYIQKQILSSEEANWKQIESNSRYVISHHNMGILLRVFCWLGGFIVECIWSSEQSTRLSVIHRPTIQWCGPVPDSLPFRIWVFPVPNASNYTGRLLIFVSTQILQNGTVGHPLACVSCTFKQTGTHTFSTRSAWTLLTPRIIEAHEWVKSWKWVFGQHFLNRVYHGTMALVDAIVWDLQHWFELLLQQNTT